MSDVTASEYSVPFGRDIISFKDDLLNKAAEGIKRKIV